MVANVKKVGDYLGKTLKAKLSNHKNVGDIRGEGFFWGVEFVEDKITKKPFDSKLGVSRLIVDCAKSPKFNMTLYPGSGTVDGVNGDHIIIAPPFMTTEEDADHIVEVILTVIEIVFNEINKKKIPLLGVALFSASWVASLQILWLFIKIFPI